jgi:NADH-quinone oxidoreductase subunit J
VATNLILFFGLAIVAIGAALGMLFSRNAVYSALYLILNLSTVAVFYLILHAPFIALAQVTVYAGAIMVLFLFVIMLLGADQSGRTQAAWWMQPLALVLGAILLLETIYFVITQRGMLPVAADVAPEFGAPVLVGETLFSQYLLPFEVTSILLLVAMVGAIVLTQRRGER